MIIITTVRLKKRTVMHEWLSGGVSPCQGEGRGFESRLVLSERNLDKQFYKGSEKERYARVAQWWSIALPRRGSRVRIPSRALREKSR